MSAFFSSLLPSHYGQNFPVLSKKQQSLIKVLLKYPFVKNAHVVICIHLFLGWNYSRAESAWDIPYCSNRKIFLFRYQIFKSTD